MPKRRWKSFKNVLEASPVQKDASATNNFSGVVAGNKLKINNYSETWPELAPTDHTSQSVTISSSLIEAPETKKLTKTEQFIQTFNGPSGTNNDCTFHKHDSSIEFPPLGSGIFTTKNKGKICPSFQSPISGESASSSPSEIKEPKKRSRPKRNSVIHIDVESAIQASILKKKKSPKRLVRRPERILTGNILDSSNPTRKKGKVRPHKRKNLTTLKKLILQGRALLKEAVSEKIHNVDIIIDSRDENDQVSFDVKNEILNTEEIPDEKKYLHPENVIKLVKERIHSKKFPLYCTNMHSKELDLAVGDFLQTLRRFQDRAYAESEIKARSRRRLVLGIHECRRRLNADLLQLLIIPVNIENVPVLWETVENLKSEAARRGVPVIFAAKCQTLSKCLFKKNRTCAVGIINYDGADEPFKKVMELFEREKQKYEELVDSVKIQLGLMDGQQEKRPSLEESLAKSLLDTLKLEDTHPNNCEE